MKLLELKHFQEADKITIEKQNISRLELIERAGQSVFQLLHERLQGAPLPIHVFCGLGDNGADGLVIARHLVEHGYNVTTYIVNFSSERSKGFLTNYDKLKEISKEWPVQIKSEDDFPAINSSDMVIDAIFGLGLNRSIQDWVQNLIKYINKLNAFTLSVDIPSGLFLNKAPEDKEAVIYANTCLTFQTPKLVFFLPEGATYIQDLEILDIGLDKEYLNSVKTGVELIGKPEVVSSYIPRQKFSHKGTFGHSLIIGGSRGKVGSMVLASKACLKVGSGLVTAVIPKCGNTVMQSSIPEAMVVDTNEGVDYINDFNTDVEATVTCVGVGLSKQIVTINAFTEFLKTNKAPLVLDADALNILSENKELLEKIPSQSILTPHLKELERLIGSWKDDFEKLEKTKAFSTKYDCIVVIKGANTITVYKDNLFVNTTGNPGMATAGSGDVLAGIITGLISQGYSPLVASFFGVYIHGSAADIAVNGMGYQALIASDIIDNIGKAYLELFRKPEQQQPQQ